VSEFVFFYYVLMCLTIYIYISWCIVLIFYDKSVIRLKAEISHCESATVRHMCFFLSWIAQSASFQNWSGVLDDAPEEEELSNFFRNESWASRGAARARLLYTGPAISYGRRFRPITLTRLTRAIQSANVRGLRLRSLAVLRAKSSNKARWEFCEVCIDGDQSILVHMVLH